MPNRAIIASCNWDACDDCRHGADGCRIDSDDFRYEEKFDAFVCENFEHKRKDEG